MLTMFENFTSRKISFGDYTVNLEMAGDGPGLLLLHGFPETKAAWHKIAPDLAKNKTVIISDLPGYGNSTGPAPDKEHTNYSKRKVGNIMARAMAELGFTSYAIAGHDRGARVAYRMALDHSNVITHLAVLNILPTYEMVKHLNYDVAMMMENWLFLSQPHPLPETLINANPHFYLNHILDSWAAKASMISTEARQEYLHYFKKPEVIETICEEYRATNLDASYDYEDSVNQNRIACPTLVLWSQQDELLDLLGNPVTVWKNWAENVTGAALPGGHFLMEESPTEVLEQFVNFFSA